MRVRGNDRRFLFFDSLLISSCFDDHLPFRLIQWNPSPAPANQPLPNDSSESDGHSPVPYGELDALRFKAELETAQRELEDVSKKAGIAELEWEDQRKQLLETIDGTALKSIFDPTRPLMLISFFLAPCSPRCRAQPVEDAGGAAGR
jgi:hypothetical protein